ncbi:MAG: arsenate reductase (azurin) large subunit [Hydrogenobacter sp.]
MAMFARKDKLPIPPKNAEKYTTVCQYCNVGCGYYAYVWPVGQEGGLKANENALGIDFTKQQQALEGQAYVETMHSIITKKDGRQYHLMIVPAKDSLINRGNYSIRGGTNAQATYSPTKPTRNRLHYPLVRVGDEFMAVSWDEAIDLIARVVKGVKDKWGPDSVAMKIHDHGGSGSGFEDNWAVGKFFFIAVGTRMLSIHNRPAYNSEVWGQRERGTHELNYTYEDARLADTIVLWGANSFETASVFYTEHMLPNFQGATIEEKKKEYLKGEPAEPARLIVVDPRRTASVTVAESIDKSRVLHLRPNLGTDYVLANAIARAVWEKGWWDKEFVEKRTDLNTFEDYKKKSLMLDVPYDEFMRRVEKLTGVSREDIEKAAEWIAKPKAGGFRRRVLTIYEKGVIWGYKNYDTIAAIAQLAALTGNYGKPGTGCGRQGGHQEGYVRPHGSSRAKLVGSIYAGGPPPNIDKYVMNDPKAKVYFVSGTDPYLSTPNSQAYKKRVHERTLALTKFLSEYTASAGEPAGSEERARRILEGLEKTDGLFLVVINMYEIETAKDAHVILPAAGWGETPTTYINCNSRLLRIADQFMDPPGEAKPDWWIWGRIATRMKELYEAEGKYEEAKYCAGMDWKTAEEVFLDGANDFPDNRVSEADEAILPAECYKGVTHEYLRKVGQKGIQVPVRIDPKTGQIVGTKRRYAYRFGTPDGKFKWYGTDPWEPDPMKFYPPQITKYFKDGNDKKFPFWFTNGRTQIIWQTGYNDRHLPEKVYTIPMPYIEMNPQDAQRLGIKNGDIVELFNLEGNCVCVVYVNDAPPPGTVYGIMYHWKGSLNHLTTDYTDPKTTIPWYKASRVDIRKLKGNVKDILKHTSFLPINDFT